jgi:hypothetical protein
MGIFTSIEKHDLEFESKVIRDKFTITGGNDRNGGWTIIELKPKPGNEDYKGQVIFHISRVVDYFRSECPETSGFEYGFVMDFVKREIERYNIKMIKYPWKFQAWKSGQTVEEGVEREGEYEIVPLYIIPRPFWKTMSIDFLALNRPWTEMNSSFTKDFSHV